MSKLRWGLFVVISLATRGPLVGVEYLAGDEATHLLGGRALAEGGLYVDFVDNKPPLNHALYAVGDALGGMVAVHLVLVLVFVPLTALALSAFFRHDRRGLLAGLGWLVYSVGFRADDFHAANSELLLLAPATWGLALVAHEEDLRDGWRPLASGVLFGVAALFKPQATVWLAAVAAAFALLPRHRARAIALLVAGFVLPLAATAAWFAASGTLDELVYWNVGYNLGYSANPLPLRDGLLATARTLVVAGLVLPLLVVVPRSLGLLPRHQRRLLIAALICTVPAVCVGLRFFFHYFLLFYPLLVLVAAPSAEALLARLERPLPRLFFAWPVAAAFVWLVVNATRLVGGRVETTDPKWNAIAWRLTHDRCSRGASLFLWGTKPILYTLSRLRPASRFVVPQGTIAGYVAGNPAVQEGRVSARGFVLEDHWDLLMGDLERSRVTYLVDLSAGAVDGWQHFPLSDFPRLASYVDRELEPIDEIDGVRIYRRRGCDSLVAP